ncbi:MAG: alpha/beta hydrolase [Robiginitomaculum sp.]|nr:alpha/beta hydrolase [Robiginitomaculum sp.]
MKTIPNDSLAKPFSRSLVKIDGGKVNCISSETQFNQADIVFVHATGFNARTYLPLYQQLITNHSISALDMRGHGHSTLDNQVSFSNWHIYRDDLISFLENFSQPPVLVGHSMGGTVSLLTAAKRPDLMRSVIAFDPPILPRILQLLMRSKTFQTRFRKYNPLVMSARNRRRTFDDLSSAIARYENKLPFAKWQDGFLGNYLQDGLRKHNGTMQLSCNPEWEVKTYMAHGHDIWGALKSTKRAALLVGGDSKGTVLTDSRLRQLEKLNPLIQTKSIPNSGHFLPMEKPELATQIISDFIGDQT